MSVAEPVATPPSRRVFRFAARLALLAWTGFWTWFIASVAISEWPATEPWLGLALLWALSLTAWLLPRAGAIVLLAFAAWSAWYFAGSTALLLIVGPPCAVAMLSWLGAPRSKA